MVSSKSSKKRTKTSQPVKFFHSFFGRIENTKIYWLSDAIFVHLSPLQSTSLINDWKKLLEMITFLFSARNIWSKIKGGALGQQWKQYCTYSNGAHHLLSSLVIIRSKCRKFFLIRLSFDSKPWKKFKILFWSYCSPEGLKLFKTSSLSCSK